MNTGYQHSAGVSNSKAEALRLYQEKLEGKTVADLEQSQELRDFIKENQEKWGFHLHLKNGTELDPCDGHHEHEALHAKHECLDDHCEHEEHDHAHIGKQHSPETHEHQEHNHSHEHDHHQTKSEKGFLQNIIDQIAASYTIPKSLKPLAIRGTINLTNIFLAQGLSAPLGHAHVPGEITSSSAVAGMHLMNYGAKQWQNLAKNLLTIVPFVSLHRVLKVPNFVMRSALGLAISITEQLSNGDKNQSLTEKLKDTFSKDASKFIGKVVQMETMLNTAIPLGGALAKHIPNKALAFITQNLAMAGAFTVIPEIFKQFKGKSETEDSEASNAQVATAELLECPVCGEAHGADVHLAEISEGVSAAGASNASNHDNLHTLMHGQNHDHTGGLI